MTTAPLTDDDLRRAHARILQDIQFVMHLDEHLSPIPDDFDAAMQIDLWRRLITARATANRRRQQIHAHLATRRIEHTQGDRHDPH